MKISIVTVWVCSIILLLTLVAIPLAHAQMTLDITRADADKPVRRRETGNGSYRTQSACIIDNG